MNEVAHQLLHGVDLLLVTARHARAVSNAKYETAGVAIKPTHPRIILRHTQQLVHQPLALPVLQPGIQARHRQPQLPALDPLELAILYRGP